MRKKSKISFGVTVLFFSFILVPFLSRAEEKPATENPVALVNGSKLTQSVLDREIFRLTQQFLRMGKTVSDSQLMDIKKDALENIINHELFYQESQKEGVKVEETDISNQIDMIKKRFPSDAVFKEEMKKLNLTESELISEIKRGLIVQKFINNRFGQKITVSSEEMKGYYDKNPLLFKQPEQMKASHILIKVDPQADESTKLKARKKMEEIKNKLKGGEDFAELAKEYSQCPSSAQGGDLNYFRKGQMVKPFEEAAYSLKTGTVSDIVETQFGYHLIKATDKRPENTISYEEARGRIEQFLKQGKLQKEIKEYASKLQESAKIERLVK